MKNIFRKKITNSEENNQGKEKNRKKRKYIIIFSTIIIVIAVGIRIYFNNERVKNIIEKSVYSSLNRKIEINNFKYSLLFTKIELNGITLYNSTKFDEKENIKLDTLRIRLSIFKLIFLRVHIKEILIDNLYISMFTDKQGNWNIPDLPPSEEKIKETNKEPFDLKKLDFLKFRADIENIRINNLKVHADSINYTTNNNGILASLNSFNFHFDLNTKRFKLSEVVGINAINTLKKLNIRTFITNDVSYQNNTISFNDDTKLDLNISLPKEVVDLKDYNKDEILLKFQFEIDNPNFIYNNIKRDDLQLAFDIQVRYNKKTQNLYIDNIQSEILNDEILKIVAEANNIFKKDIGVNIDTLYARLDLKKLNRLSTMIVPQLGINMSGNINIDVAKTFGTINNINNNIDISLDKIDFIFGKTISIKNLNSKTKLGFNFNKNEKSKNDIQLEHNTTIERAFALNKYPVRNVKLNFNAFSSLDGIFDISSAMNDKNKKSDTEVYINDISLDYLQSKVAINGKVKFDDPTDLNINIKSLPVAHFSGEIARGALDADINIYGRLLDNLRVKLDGDINNFSYNLSGEVSSLTKAKLIVDANANIISKDVRVRKLDIDLGNFFNFKSNMNLKGFGAEEGFINISTLRIAPYSIKNWLSPNYKSLVESLPFEDDIKLTSKLQYNLALSESKASITNYTTLFVTEKQYNLQDVKMNIDADVDYKNDLKLNIDNFEITSKTNNLLVSVKGYYTQNLKNTDLKYKVGLDTKSLYLPFGLEVGGLIDIDGILKNNIASGKFNAKDFFMNKGEKGKETIVLNGLQSDINYNFNLIPEKDSSSIKVEPVRYNPLKTKSPNLFFKQLRVYLKVGELIDDSIRLTDFSTSIKIDNHIITIQDLKSSLYIGGEKFDDKLFFQSIENNTAPRRGAIRIPWLNINLASFNTQTIKYDTRILASDINFKYLIPAENRYKINDDKLLVNLTADIAGTGISPLSSINTSTFFVGISKMSTEFSKALIEIIRPINPGIAVIENIVQFGYDPNSVEFSISANKVFTTFYFRDQNLDKIKQQKQQLLVFEGDKFGLDPMPFSDVVSYLEGNK